MPRWDPEGESRLREAALQLFLERGYENVTVAEITERAGLTRRTFSRYFADKRDVLFAGSDELPAVIGDRIRTADAALAPMEAVLAALDAVAERLADQAAIAARRQAVVRASPELQERALTKFAVATDAAADALRSRGVPASTATLLAQVAIAIFRTAFERWLNAPAEVSLRDRVRESAAELSSSFGSQPS
ncbi:helix-turn-helix domain-containing protein [Gryllotalpicola koreensis]|uniref:TetR/AcrR family transcriptional regulator n=1 Tax=Gryllotalpicola koreensis TaxID=993086 RepID=A0ABP8A9T1_9MICO